MFDLKIKLLKHLQKNGNKFTNEKFLKILLKNINKKSKKNYIKTLQLVIGHFCLIFKTTKLKNNKPYYFKNSVRISFAVKKSLVFIKNQKKNNYNYLNNFENNSHNNLIGEKKLFYFYRWSLW
jgi:hypothetical protein